MRGGKKPLLLKSTSKPADASGLPPPELIFTCAYNAMLVMAIARVKIVFFILLVFIVFNL
jgi:hypothetical protein